MIFVFLADGFEEMEALAPIDLLRRAGLDVRTVGVGSMTPTGAHGVTMTADMSEAEAAMVTDIDAVVLPGGMPGTRNLENSSTVRKILTFAMDRRLPIGAICAAPSVLGHLGYLAGRKAVCYPGFESELIGATQPDSPTPSVITDGTITTAKGAGVATEFALELVRRLVSAEKAEEIRGSIQCR